MLQPNWTCLFLISLLLVACGQDSNSTDEPSQPLAQSDETSGECGEGGTRCPDGLECVTWRDGSQACGPMSGPGTVLIKDATLGGGCLSPNPADPYPGASIASVSVIGVDGNVKGHGRHLWDEAGFEVAAERGAPPDGSEFTGDACTEFFNLGCDGQAIFEIVDEAGKVQKLREGQMVIVHMRGQETCGEEVADGLEAAVCNDPAATAQGNLESCTTNVRMIEARSDMYGPDRMGGTINFFQAQ